MHPTISRFVYSTSSILWEIWYELIGQWNGMRVSDSMQPNKQIYIICAIFVKTVSSISKHCAARTKQDAIAYEKWSIYTFSDTRLIVLFDVRLHWKLFLERAIHYIVKKFYTSYAIFELSRLYILYLLIEIAARSLKCRRKTHIFSHTIPIGICAMQK